MHLFSILAITTAEAKGDFHQVVHLLAASPSNPSALPFLSAMTYQTAPLFTASARVRIRCFTSFRALRRSSTDSPA